MLISARHKRQPIIPRLVSRYSYSEVRLIRALNVACPNDRETIHHSFVCTPVSVNDGGGFAKLMLMQMHMLKQKIVMNTTTARVV